MSSSSRSERADLAAGATPPSPTEDTARSATNSDERAAQWITLAAELVRRARRGDLEPRLLGIDVDGDLGELLHGLNDLLDVVDAFVREAGASLDHVSRREFFRTVHERGFGGSFARSSRIINAATEAMHEENEELLSLRRRQFELADTFEANVQGLADTVAAASTQLNVTASQLSKDATNGTQELEKVVAAAHTASENVAAMANAADSLSHASREISEEVLRANGVVDRAVDESSGGRERVAELSVSSEAIGSIVAMIDEVAEQTNMLALNAAIEAARAGDAGRGFAIVATEVKALAGQTSESTKRIEGRVESIQGTSRAAVESLRDVADTLAEVHTISSSIQDAVERQHAVTDDVRHNTHGAARLVNELTTGVEAVSQVSERTSAASREILEASGGLSRLAERLRAEVDEFVHQVRGDG